ncbi:oligosaccharide flippase family protein [Vibrio diabolicus]|uniref:oligosaccharide flippase family protein n=1 Tax=Vibrio diabolicus TaxID=50719 RepID=UPI00215E5FFB|nr:oligosaccharide flippase family protein [Vibrio diabolicus]MCS0378416.1 oligosaccharide flippase family protein [Vibrio diabolicus]MCS0422189.1 oligosaccharide flippase family protein [Vibrio diabolicus]
MIKSSFLLYLLSRLSGGVFSILTISVLTRELSLETYGKYSLAMTIVLMTSSVSYTWIAHSINRFVPENIEIPNATTSQIFKYTLISSLIVTVIYSIVFWFYKDFFGLKLIALMLFSSIALGIYSNTTQIKNAIGKHSHYAGMIVTKNIIYYVPIFCYSFFYDINVLDVVFLFFLSLVLTTFIYRERWFEFGLKRKNKELVSYSIPLTLNTLAIVVIDASDKFVINYFYGEDALGIYSSAYDFSQQSTGALFSIALLMFFPKMVKSYSNNDKEKFIYEKENLNEMTLFFCYFFITIFFSCSEWISQLIYGSEFRNKVSDIMPLVSLAVVFCAIKNNTIDTELKLRKKTSIISRVSFFMAVVNLSLNFIFIPMLGVIGAAYSTLLSFFLGMVLGDYYLNWKSFSGLKWKLIAKLAVCSLFVISLSIFLPSELSYSVLIFNIITVVSLTILFYVILNHRFFKMRFR